MTRKILDMILKALPNYPEDHGLFWGHGPLQTKDAHTAMGIITKEQLDVLEYG